MTQAHTPACQQPIWQQLQQSAKSAQNLDLKQCFSDNPARAQQFCCQGAGIFVDYSKNRITTEIWQQLLQLPHAADLPYWQQQMRQGAPINQSEGRAVAHIALRDLSSNAFLIDGENVVPAINAQLNKMRQLVEAVRGGTWRGFSGASINRVINIGIGGSELGAKMALKALHFYASKHIKIDFVANIDSAALAQALAKADPARTLFIVCSKSFATPETRSNAQLARQWFLQHHPDTSALAQHFVGVTSNSQAASDFGIAPEQQYAMWDWVGGRYSLWSAVGLALAIGIGWEHFLELLAGAHDMDQHFFSAPFEQNLPVILALLGVWYQSFLGAQSHAIIPYAQDLALLPEYMQQLDMESNGKSVDKNGLPISYQTAPVVWGSAGSNGQHAYFQLLHQGTPLISADFIIVKHSHTPLGDNHQQLLANAIAQMQALMHGQSEAQTRAILAAQNLPEARIDKLAPYKTFAGNKPSTAIVMDQLTPRALGALIAMYEHKIFVEGVIWNINSFDQFGVELGKVLAENILTNLDNPTTQPDYDSSTAALVERLML